MSHENRRRHIVNELTTNASIKQQKIKDCVIYNGCRTNAIRMYNFNAHFVIECLFTRDRLGTVACLTVGREMGHWQYCFRFGESSKGTEPTPIGLVRLHALNKYDFTFPSTRMPRRIGLGTDPDRTGYVKGR